MKFVKKADIVVISIIVCIALICLSLYHFNFSKKPVVAEIYFQSKCVKVIDLTENKDYKFSISEKPHVVFHVFSDGSICFEESDCPDKICVKTGKIDSVGESAACLPNEIVVKIVPKNKSSEDDLDIVIGK